MNIWIQSLWATIEAQNSNIPFTLWRAYEHDGLYGTYY